MNLTSHVLVLTERRDTMRPKNSCCSKHTLRVPIVQDNPEHESTSKKFFLLLQPKLLTATSDVDIF